MAEASDCISLAIRDALDWLGYGVLLVNADARVAFINSRAQELVRAQELTILAGQLRAGSLAQTALLHELISRYARQNGETSLEAEGNHHWVGRLMLQFAPVSPAFTAHVSEQRLVAIFVVDPDHAADPTPQQLQLQFGLTPAEAELAHEIAKGEGLIACAKALHISRATASTHLQRIFEKTGTKRQAQLVRVILGVRPALRPAPSRVVPLSRHHAND
jgi:DNA-binding CsgD family transcriptional regulator